MRAPSRVQASDSLGAAERSSEPLALALPAATLEALAERVAELLVERGLVGTSHASEDRWLSTREAAEYLGLTANALHKLTAAREVPFEQDAPGGKCWFRRSELDEWRRHDG